MEKYVKKIENQTTVAMITLTIMFVLAVGVQCMYRFTDVMPKVDLGSWVIYVAVVLPAVAAGLYIVAVPYSKKKYRSMVGLSSLTDKLEAYLSFMANLKVIVIVLSFIMAVVSILVQLNLVMLVCMALFIEMLVNNAMSANQYMVKQRLQLTNDEMNQLYGEGWEEKNK